GTSCVPARSTRSQSSGKLRTPIFGLLARRMSRTDHPRRESMLRTTLLVLPLLFTGNAVADAQAVGHRVKVNGMQMYYEVSGRGDPLIVLHGGYMNIPMMGVIVPKLTVEMMVQTPFAAEYKKLAPNPNGFPELARKIIALQQEPMAWAADVKGIKLPVLIIAGDADGVTLEHAVAMIHLLGGGAM